MEDIYICEKIFGPDIYTFEVKTVRNKQRAVVNDYIDIPH